MISDDIKEVDSYDFDEKSNDGIVMLIFSESYDVQSRAMESIFAEIAERYYERVNFLEIDTEQSPDIAVRFGIEIIPSALFLKDGKVFDIITGANPPSVYADMIEEIFSEK